MDRRLAETFKEAERQMAGEYRDDEPAMEARTKLLEASGGNVFIYIASVILMGICATTLERCNAAVAVHHPKLAHALATPIFWLIAILSIALIGIGIAALVTWLLSIKDKRYAD
jgi:hypothetical protein